MVWNQPGNEACHLKGRCRLHSSSVASHYKPLWYLFLLSSYLLPMVSVLSTVWSAGHLIGTSTFKFSATGHVLVRREYGTSEREGLYKNATAVHSYILSLFPPFFWLDLSCFRTIAQIVISFWQKKPNLKWSHTSQSKQRNGERERERVRVSWKSKLKERGGGKGGDGEHELPRER